MAESGFLIDNHYTSSPICVLARQTLTFGKYVSYHMYGIIQLNVLMVSFSSKNSLPNGYDAILVGDMKYNGNNYGLSNYTEARGIISPNEGKKYGSF